MDDRPIGIFDSGLGGLTAVREFRATMPNEAIVYFGDTGRVPYGTRSKETIRKYAQQDVAFLASKNVKMILAACGTVSSVAGDVGETSGIPFTGVLEPTVNAAIRASKNGKIGVIGTPATIRSGEYGKRIRAAGREVFEYACPLLVPLVENGLTDQKDPVVYEITRRYLAFFSDKGIDTLILGCTHYPLLREVIAKIMGGTVLIDSGREAALYCARFLSEKKMLSDRSEKGSAEFYVSDRAEGFSQMAKICLGETLPGSVESVDIDRYR